MINLDAPYQVFTGVVSVGVFILLVFAVLLYLRTRKEIKFLEKEINNLEKIDKSNN
jgi:hypothetical protein